jgi:hypothetical protein
MPILSAGKAWNAVEVGRRQGAAVELIGAVKAVG